MADTPPWLEYQAPRAVPLSGPDPDLPVKRAKAAADLQAAAQEARLRQLNIAKAEDEAKSRMTATTPGDPRLTGDEYLATLPPELAGQVKALAEGRRPFPNNASMRSPAMQTLVAAATQYDPTLDATNSVTRVATRKKFTSGTTRDNITALNTALGHLGTLWTDAQKLGNFGSPILNAPVNYAETKVLGDERYTNFNLTRQAVVDELEKAFRGSGGTQTGIEGWKESINSSQSPKQLRGAIGKAVELLDSRLQALNDAYSAGMGRSSEPLEFLNPHARAVFNALGPGGDGNVPPTPKNFGGAPPILGGSDKPPPGPSGGTPDPMLGLATGATRNQLDPKATAKLDSAIRAGLPYNIAMSLFPGAKPADRATYEAAVQFAKTNPGYNKSLAEVTNSVSTTAFQRFAASPLAAGIAGSANALTAGTTDEIAAGLNHLVGGNQSLEEINAKKQLLAAENPGADLVGNVIGGAGAMLGGGAALRGLGLVNRARAAANPLLASLAGDTAYGAAYGAGENNDARGIGALAGGAAGLVGSGLGTGVARGAGAVLQGVGSDAVRNLQRRGVPLTVGEVLGGGWKKAQDAMTSIPVVGGMVARRYNEGRQALNREAFNEAGNIIGAPINMTGQPAVAALDAAKSQAYENALNPISLNLNNPQAIGDISAALNSARSIPNVDQASDLATGAIQNYIGGSVDPTGMMTGQNFQQAYRRLGRTARTASPRIYGHEIGQSLGQARDALVTSLENQNPGAYAAFLRANLANRHLTVLANAVKAAQNQEGQLFTPAQLGTAATQNAITYGSRVSAAAGRRPFNQLARNAQEVMSSKLPDSGTPARQMVALGLGALGGTAAGGGAGYGTGGGEGAVEGALAPAALLTLLGTRRGQALLTSALMRRTVGMQRSGQAITRNPQVGASIFAAAGIPLLTGE